MAAGARVSPPNPRNDSKGKLNGKVEFEIGTPIIGRETLGATVPTEFRRFVEELVPEPDLEF